MGLVLIQVELSAHVGFDSLTICLILIFADHVDEEYQRFTDMAREIIKNDPDLQPYYHEKGFTFCMDGNEGPMETL